MWLMMNVFLQFLHSVEQQDRPEDRDREAGQEDLRGSLDTPGRPEAPNSTEARNWAPLVAVVSNARLLACWSMGRTELAQAMSTPLVAA